MLSIIAWESECELSIMRGCFIDSDSGAFVMRNPKSAFE